MINQGYWKDFYTQEYLEELVRLTFPRAKVNNITPFIWTGNYGDTLEVDNNIVYYCKVYALIDWGAHIINEFQLNGIDLFIEGSTDFIMFQKVLSIGPTQIVGYKITLDNEIINIYADEEAPLNDSVSGGITRLVVFYSADANNSTGVQALGMRVIRSGETDAAEMFTPFPIVIDAVGDVIAVVGSGEAAPFTVRARGTLSANNALTSNELTRDVEAEMKPYDYEGFDVDLNAVSIRNVTLGASFVLKHLRGVTTLFTSSSRAPNPGNDFFVQKLFTDVEVGDILSVTPTVDGYECPFEFYHVIL